MADPKENDAQILKLAVCGMWHLGTVTAACCATAGFKTLCFDEDDSVIQGLKTSVCPIYEPFLEEQIRAAIQCQNISFTSQKNMLGSVDICWITYDTPVDNLDKADDLFVVQRIIELSSYLRKGAILLISSQLPLGSCAKLKNSIGRSDMQICVSPENLRLGSAIDAFNNQQRIIVGCDSEKPIKKLDALLSAFCDQIIWMSPASAEMTKHSINAFLGMSIAFTNELASVAEQYDANFSDVEKALRSEPRIGRKAYVRPGEAFAGGTLARDLKYLAKLAEDKNVDENLISSVLVSNENHKSWAFNHIIGISKKLAKSHEEIQISILGISYKENSNTTRRSSSLDLIERLLNQNFQVRAFDPLMLSRDITSVDFSLNEDLKTCICDSDIIVIARRIKELDIMSSEDLHHLFDRPNNSVQVNKYVIDSTSTYSELAECTFVNYVTLGRPQNGT